MRFFRTILLLPAAVTACIAATLAAAAQDRPMSNWPARTVTILVPFGAGGATDGVARLIAQHLSEQLSQRFVIENRAGGAGNVATAAVAHAAPDGYTLLLGSTGPMAVNKLIYSSLSFDPVRDFSPIALIGIVPQAIVVGKRLPVRTLQELVAHAKANPGKLNFGNSGVGAMAHITAVSLAKAAGLDVAHVTYRSGAQALNDLLGGTIDVAFPTYIPQVATMNMLAVTATERMKEMPNVPTVRETGVADIVAGPWFGLVAPAGTPPEIVAKVNREVNAFIKTPKARELFDTIGLHVMGGTPEAMRSFMAEETARWAPVVEWAKIRIN
jgi:tripartite-type tricarboxylate transporter receptor subunit TctC